MKAAGVAAIRPVLAVFLAFIATAPLYLPDFYVTLLNYIGMATLVTLGLVLLTGVVGLISFGQQAFVGLAAYTTAVLTTMRMSITAVYGKQLSATGETEQRCVM